MGFCFASSFSNKDICFCNSKNILCLYFVTPLLLFKPRATKKHTHTHMDSQEHNITQHSPGFFLIITNVVRVFFLKSQFWIFQCRIILSWFSLTLLSLCNFCFSVYRIVFDFPLFSYCVLISVCSCLFFLINVHKNKLFFSFYMIFVAF